MIYSTALQIAKQVVKENPSYVLCGSVALILAKVLPEREVSDIDFIAPKVNLSETTLQMMNYTGATVKTGYATYKQDVVLDGLRGFYYNIFVHDNVDIRTQVVDGITIQNVDTILKYKVLYAREKDVEDLNKIGANK